MQLLFVCWFLFIVVVFPFIGLCRTCQIFSVQGLVLSNLKILEEKQFQSLSVTSEKWLSLSEVYCCYSYVWTARMWQMHGGKMCPST